MLRLVLLRPAAVAILVDDVDHVPVVGFRSRAGHAGIFRDDVSAEYYQRRLRH